MYSDFKDEKRQNQHFGYNPIWQPEPPASPSPVSPAVPPMPTPPDRGIAPAVTPVVPPGVPSAVSPTPWPSAPPVSQPTAPAAQTEAPTPVKTELSEQKRHFPNYDRNVAFAPRSNEWREPLYTPRREEAPSNMYTPGIYVGQHYSRPHRAEYKPENKSAKTGSRIGRFLFAACLVLICAIVSGATAFFVNGYSQARFEARLKSGEFATIQQNQVVLGGSQETQNNSGYVAPLYSNSGGMSPEDIYVMACTQVVTINTEVVGTSSMFGGIVPGSSSAVSGSGFVISSDGYILTNYHVVETAYEGSLPLIVRLIDGTEYEAQVIGYDKNYDVALIKIEADGLSPVVFADSDLINVGQSVFAVGNPLGELVYTMTDGIVSARDREVSVEGKTINMFQISAAVNSGNSGGPVFNTNGEVIGIVTAKPSRASVEGIGFAIPINDAIIIAADLIEHGYITGRPLMGIMGVTVQTVLDVHAEYYDDLVVGTRVESVAAGSAAETAGLLVGDIIIGLGEKEIDSMEALIFAMRSYRAGDTETLKVWRGGEEVELTITFDEDLSAGQLK